MTSRAGWFAAVFCTVSVSMAADPPRLHAEEPTVVKVTIRDHRFSPSTIRVPAGKPASLEVTNEDDTAEEFDSPALKIEKVIPGGRKSVVRLRPLEPGEYPFSGEYHADTAKGTVVAVTE